MYLPHDEYIKSLSRKIVASGAFIFDEQGKMLIVKPNYRDHWNIPGGVSDEGESPLQTCGREVLEEVGLKLDYKQLLCVDHNYTAKNHEDSLKFFFYGGVLTKEQVGKISLQNEELDEYAFKPIDECSKLLSPRMARRLPNCIEAIKTKVTLALETKS
ncbi:MAG: NUDIX hydrolase [Patescibacteria group bacterium]